jgi:hypothetical protein
MEHKLTPDHSTPVTDDVSRKLRLINVALVVIALFTAVVMIRVDMRLGLIPAAVILGWTQLVGL